VEVVPLCDGFAPLPLSEEAPGHEVDWAAERAAYPWAFADDAHWAWHVHAFLLRTAGEPILVDTGIGHLGRPPYDVAGRIEQELAEAGTKSDEIRHVLHTHLHADHAGGACTPDGEPRFPNAVHHVHPADWELFAGSTDPDDFQGRTAMEVLEETAMLDLDPDDREVVPGVRVVHAPGHTAGHRSVIATDGGSSLLLTGDLLHVPFQIAHPDWPSGHDRDADRAAASRVALLDRARDGAWSVAVGHFGAPFGRVVREDGGQRWVSEAPA
jgi:glyoxylase-like metal-dependent hydrolase (beta-lactamase superfamily II)